MEKFSMKMHLKYFSFFISLLLVIKCANQQPPPGGPKDTEPPKILDVYHKNIRKYLRT